MAQQLNNAYPIDWRYVRREVDPPAPGAVHDPPRCLLCGEKLRRDRHLGDKGFGRYADNAFCSMRCGYVFGVLMAKFGHRLKPTGDK